MCTRHMYANISEHPAGGERRPVTDDHAGIDSGKESSLFSRCSDELAVWEQIGVGRGKPERLARCELAYERVVVGRYWLVDLVNDVDHGMCETPAAGEALLNLASEYVIDLDATPSVGLFEESKQRFAVTETLRLPWYQCRLDEQCQRSSRSALDPEATSTRTERRNGQDSLGTLSDPVDNLATLVIRNVGDRSWHQPILASMPIGALPNAGFKAIKGECYCRSSGSGLSILMSS